MITRLPYFLFVAAFMTQQALSFQVLNTKVVSTSPSSNTHPSATSTSINYSNDDVQALDKSDRFRNSILNTYQREEPHVSVSELLTEQVAREFTTGRRYLLAAAAVKELSEDFYDVEEQQRVRAVELMEYARSHDIPIMDYSAHVDKTPIDKSMDTTDLLQELLVQEQRDVKLLERVMAQVSSKNSELFKFLESIRADQMERKAQITETLSQNLSSLQTADMETVTSVAAGHVTASDFSTKMYEDLMKHLENADQLPSNLARWAENHSHGMGQHFHDLTSKLSGLVSVGATAATVAAVDAVDPEALSSTSQLVEVSQIVDIVSGLY